MCQARRFVFLTLLPFLLCATAIAQNQPPKFSYITTVTVKAGTNLQFEGYVKKFVEAANIVGAKNG